MVKQEQAAHREPGVKLNQARNQQNAAAGPRQLDLFDWLGAKRGALIPNMDQG